MLAGISAGDSNTEPVAKSSNGGSAENLGWTRCGDRPDIDPCVGQAGERGGRPSS